MHNRNTSANNRMQLSCGGSVFDIGNLSPQPADAGRYARSKSMMWIADLEFEVSSSRLEAYCHGDKMQWDIHVHCNSHSEGAFHRHEPKLSLSLFETPSQTLSYWTDLAPRDARWLEKNDTDVTPSGMLYIFEHTPIFECIAQLRNERGIMQVKVNGKCDVYYDEQYDTNLDLRLDSEVVFHCVWFGRRPESECRAAISAFLDPNDFDYSQTEHGVSMLIPKQLA